MDTLSDEAVIAALEACRDHLSGKRAETDEGATTLKAAVDGLHRLSAGMQLVALRQSAQVPVNEALDRAQARNSRRDDENT